jgi:CRISPR-associated protein Csb2
LEQRDAPLIITPDARPTATYMLYVPNNDSDKEFDRQDRLTSKIARPYRLMNGWTLHYLWRIDEGEWSSARSYVELLAHESRHLLALGWGIDLVAGDGKILTADEAAALKGQRWRPWDGIGLQTGTHRVPTKGSLENLEQSYVSFLNSVQGRHYQPRAEPHVFRRVSYLLASAMAPRPYISFELRQTDDRWATFHHVDVIKVAAMLRHVACEAAKGDSYEFPGGSERYVAGHASNRNDRSPRFSYLPLPTVGHRHADGMIRRVLIAEPYGSEGAQVRWAEQRLRNRTLVNDNGQEQAFLLNVE